MKCIDEIRALNISDDAKKALENQLDALGNKLKDNPNAKQGFLWELEALFENRRLYQVDRDSILAVANKEKHSAATALYEKMVWRKGAGKPAFDNYYRRINDMIINWKKFPAIGTALAKSLRIFEKDDLRKVYMETPEKYKADVDKMLDLLKDDVKGVPGADEMIEGWRRHLYNPIAPEQLKLFSAGKSGFIAKSRDLVSNSDDELARFYDDALADKENVASLDSTTKRQESIKAWDLKFKDDDAWVKWNKEFGEPNFGAAFKGAWGRVAKQAALSKLTKSSNPVKHLRKLNQDIRAREGNSIAYQKNEMIIREITGGNEGWRDAKGPVHKYIARPAQTISDTTGKLSNGGKLEYTMILMNLTQAATHSMWQSANFLSNKSISRINFFGRNIYEIVKRGGIGKENLHALNMMDLTTQGSAMAKFTSEEGFDRAQLFGAGKVAQTLDRSFYKGNLLEWSSTAEHASYALRNARYFHEDVQRGWNNLDAHSKEKYESVGFTPQLWDKIKLDMFDSDGVPYPVLDIEKVDRGVYDMYHGFVRTEADVVSGTPTSAVQSGATTLIPGLLKDKKGTGGRIAFDNLMRLKTFVTAQFDSTLIPYTKQLGRSIYGDQKLANAGAFLRSTAIGVLWGIGTGFASRYVRYIAQTGKYIRYEDWLEEDKYAEESSIGVGAQVSYLADFFKFARREYYADNPNAWAPFSRTAEAIYTPTTLDLYKYGVNLPVELFVEDGDFVGELKKGGQDAFYDYAAIQILMSQMYDMTTKEMKKEFRESGDGLDYLKSLPF